MTPDRKGIITGAAVSSSIAADEELGGMAPEELDQNNALKLPSNAPNGSRMVPGGCAICLCPYEPDDQVTWSKLDKCQHAFHSECIIPWLAKKQEPKCPCCRQEYCVVVPLLTPRRDLVTSSNSNSIPNNPYESSFVRLPFSFSALLERPPMAAFQRAIEDDGVVIPQDRNEPNESSQEARVVPSQETTEAESSTDMEVMVDSIEEGPSQQNEASEESAETTTHDDVDIQVLVEGESPPSPSEASAPQSQSPTAEATLPSSSFPSTHPEPTTGEESTPPSESQSSPPS